MNNFSKIEIQLLDQDLYKLIDSIYNMIENNYPYLIKTDKEWSNLQDKNIFNEFKHKYLTNYCYGNTYNCEGFILFTCLKYDINRLKNILYSNNKIINSLLHFQYCGIKVTAFRVFLNHYYYNDYNMPADSQLNKYIALRIIVPAYSILIPYFFYINNISFSTLSAVTRYYIQFYLKKVSNYHFNDINNFKALYSIDQEFLDKYKNSILSIQDIVEDYFIKNPYIEVLNLLLEIAVKPINKLTAYHVINFIKKEKCSLSLLKSLKQKCILNNNQFQYIDSLILLNTL